MDRTGARALFFAVILALSCVGMALGQERGVVERPRVVEGERVTPAEFQEMVEQLVLVRDYYDCTVRIAGTAYVVKCRQYNFPTIEVNTLTWIRSTIGVAYADGEPRFISLIVPDGRMKVLWVHESWRPNER